MRTSNATAELRLFIHAAFSLVRTLTRLGTAGKILPVQSVAIGLYFGAMNRVSIVVFALMVPLTVGAQDKKLPVSIKHFGKDQVGGLFAEAFEREVSNSSAYKRTSEQGRGPEFYVELISVEPGATLSQQGRKSVISIVIQSFGFPNTFPVSDMWYHKVIVVDRHEVGKMAKVVLEDLNARWCNYIKSSVGGCPRERIEPALN